MTSLAKKGKVWIGTRLRVGEGVSVEDHGGDGGNMLELSGDIRDTLLVDEGVVVADARGFVEVVGFNGEALQRWSYHLGLGVRLCRPFWSANQTFGVLCGSIDYVSHVIGDPRVQRKNVFFEDDAENDGKVEDVVVLGVRENYRTVCVTMGGEGSVKMLILGVKIRRVE